MRLTKKLTILHVDDDPDDLQMLQEAIQLIDTGFEIVHAPDGLKGLEELEKMKRAAELPCLIVLDINMPRMDGKQAFKVIKNDNNFSSVPIVILSTSNNTMDKIFFQGENVEYITKPIDFAHLKRIASKLLNYCKN